MTHRVRVDVVLWMLNEDQEAGISSGLEKINLFGKPIFVVCCEQSAPYCCSGCKQPVKYSVPRPAMKDLFPLSLTVQLLEFWQVLDLHQKCPLPWPTITFIIKTSSALWEVDCINFSTEDPELRVLCRCLCPSSSFSQGESWQISGWVCQNGCSLMIAINSDNNNSDHK